VEVHLTNQPGERRELARKLAAFGLAHQLPATAVQAADLALEEHLTNVLRYGFELEQAANIQVRLAVAAGVFSIEVTDNGRAFNPLTRPEVDTSVPLDEKPVGGLGIHLIRKFMDELDYRRQDNQNVFTMRKRFSREA
jgi:anti-sigma regulatory factor (Ser/Thr protein kinase)